jgi:hypothetical protein
MMPNPFLVEMERRYRQEQLERDSARARVLRETRAAGQPGGRWRRPRPLPPLCAACARALGRWFAAQVP